MLVPRRCSCIAAYELWSPLPEGFFEGSCSPPPSRRVVLCTVKVLQKSFGEELLLSGSSVSWLFGVSAVGQMGVVQILVHLQSVQLCTIASMAIKYGSWSHPGY